MTTIGYGDISAQSDLEKCALSFAAFFSCGIFGYTINSIGSLQTKQNKQIYYYTLLGNILFDFKKKKDQYL